MYFFQDCLPDTILPFCLNTCMPYFAPVLEMNIYTIFFKRGSGSAFILYSAFFLFFRLK
jgi:hypothetical protein